jgi:PAS domain S-box-containing protein
MTHSSIMVVEDEIVVAMEIEEKLKSIGYDVVAICSSGEDAVSEIADRRPDLVLMDIRLDGELDGIQTAELIRRQHDVPVIYLTAYADDTTLNRAKLTEPFGYLVKPFSETELRTTIEVALYKHVQDLKTKEVARWFSSTINVLGAALIVTNKDGIISHLNHVAEFLTGWSHLDAAGMHLTDVYVIKDRVTGKIMENPVSMPLKVGYSSGGHFGLLSSKNKTEIDIEGTIMPITDSEGGFSGIIIAFQEVTPDDMENQGWFNHAANLYLTATLACSDGELAKAESFYRRSLLLFEKHLGSDHAKVTNIVNDLVQLYKTMGKNEEAAKLEKRVSGKEVGASVNMWM